MDDFEGTAVNWVTQYQDVLGLAERSARLIQDVLNEFEEMCRGSDHETEARRLLGDLNVFLSVRHG